MWWLRRCSARKRKKKSTRIRGEHQQSIIDSEARGQCDRTSNKTQQRQESPRRQISATPNTAAAVRMARLNSEMHERFASASNKCETSQHSHGACNTKERSLHPPAQKIRRSPRTCRAAIGQRPQFVRQPLVALPPPQTLALLRSSRPSCRTRIKQCAPPPPPLSTPLSAPGCEFCATSSPPLSSSSLS